VPFKPAEVLAGCDEKEMEMCRGKVKVFHPPPVLLLYFPSAPPWDPEEL